MVLLALFVLLLVVSFGAYAYFRSAASARIAKTYQVQEVELQVPYPLTETEQAALRSRLEKSQAKAPGSDVPPPGEPAPEAEVAKVDLQKEFQKAA